MSDVGLLDGEELAETELLGELETLELGLLDSEAEAETELD